MSQLSLPVGWYSSVDPTSGQTYYFTGTGVTQWTVPTTPYYPPPSGPVTYQAQPTRLQEPPKKLTSGQRAMKFFWEIAFLPFTGRIPLLVFTTGYLLLFLLEFITGCCGGKIFIGVWLIFNALAMAIDAIIHYFTMRNTAQYFINPAVPVDIRQFCFSPTTMLDLYFPNINDKEEQRHRNFVTFRLISFVLIKLFLFIWIFIGSICIGAYYGHHCYGFVRVMGSFSLVLHVVSLTIQIGFFVALKWARDEFSREVQEEPLQQVSTQGGQTVSTPVPIAYATPQTAVQRHEPEDEKMSPK